MWFESFAKSERHRNSATGMWEWRSYCRNRFGNAVFPLEMNPAKNYGHPEIRVTKKIQKLESQTQKFFAFLCAAPYQV